MVTRKYCPKVDIVMLVVRDDEVEEPISVEEEIK